MSAIKNFKSVTMCIISLSQFNHETSCNIIDDVAEASAAQAADIQIQCYKGFVISI